MLEVLIQSVKRFSTSLNAAGIRLDDPAELQCELMKDVHYRAALILKVWAG